MKQRGLAHFHQVPGEPFRHSYQSCPYVVSRTLEAHCDLVVADWRSLGFLLKGVVQRLRKTNKVSPVYSNLVGHADIPAHSLSSPPDHVASSQADLATSTCTETTIVSTDGLEPHLNDEILPHERVCKTSQPERDGHDRKRTWTIHGG